MGRERMAPGEWGKITTAKRGTSHVAKARIRDFDGRVRLVEATGPSADGARRILQQKLSSRVRRESDSQGLSRQSTVREIAAYWLYSKRPPNVSKQTHNTYSEVWERFCAGSLGELRLSEVTVGAIDSLLRRIHDQSPGRARHARVVVRGIFAEAVRLDLLDRNPAAQLARRTNKKLNPTRSVTLDELRHVVAAIDSYTSGVTHLADGSVVRRPGPRPTADLRDALLLLLATGGRIGEVLALLCDEIRLEEDPPNLTISGTLITPRRKGETLYRQPHRKGDSPDLTVILPDFAVDAIRYRLANLSSVHNPHQAVFVTSTGNWLSPSNVRRSWRAALGPDLAWITPHSCRRTVATVLKRDYGIEAAQEQLGHGSTAITEAHYIARSNTARDVRRALNTLGANFVQSVE